MKDPVIYMAPDCHECKEVSEYLTTHNIDVDIRFLESQEERIDKGIFIFPSLYQNDSLLAIGSDIIKFFHQS